MNVTTIPEDPEAERAMLGAVLLGRSSAFVVARALVSPADLVRPPHQQLFSAIERLHDRGDAIDVSSVASELRDWPEALEAPIGFMAGLMAAVPAASHVETYAKKIRRVATLRRVLTTANELAHVAYTSDNRTEAEAMGEVQKLVDALFDGQVGASSVLTPKERTQNYALVLAGRQEKDPRYIGFETGFSDLDRFVAYRPGELWYVAASPGVGKTTLLANFQDELSKRKIPTLFASAEQPDVQLMDRTIASDTGVDSWKIARGQLDEREWARVSAALAKRYDLPEYVYDDPSMTTAKLSAAAQLCKARYGIRVVFVDYVQLLADEQNESEYARISAISRRLAHLARSLSVCVVAACQVSRKGAEQDGQIPRLAELRGSGSLEQDAFVVLGVGRKENSSEAQVAIRKNRNGQAGVVVPLFFDAAHTRFRSVAA